MAVSQAVYIVVRLDLYNPNLDEITDDDVEDIIGEIVYESQAYGDFKIDSEVCGINE